MENELMFVMIEYNGKTEKVPDKINEIGNKYFLDLPFKVKKIKKDLYRTNSKPLSDYYLQDFITECIELKSVERLILVEPENFKELVKELEKEVKINE